MQVLDLNKEELVEWLSTEPNAIVAINSPMYLSIVASFIMDTKEDLQENDSVFDICISEKDLYKRYVVIGEEIYSLPDWADKLCNQQELHSRALYNANFFLRLLQ